MLVDILSALCVSPPSSPAARITFVPVPCGLPHTGILTHKCCSALFGFRFMGKAQHARPVCSRASCTYLCCGFLGTEPEKVVSPSQAEPTQTSINICSEWSLLGVHRWAVSKCRAADKHAGELTPRRMLVCQWCSVPVLTDKSPLTQQLLHGHGVSGGGDPSLALWWVSVELSVLDSFLSCQVAGPASSSCL
jgi:hypothetical protein